MMKRIYQLFFLLLCLPYTAAATTKTSAGNGNWNQIQWIPSGVPRNGDTIVINSAVTAIPSGAFGPLTINAGASLTVTDGTPDVVGLVNNGSLSIANAASMRVRGEITNSGTIGGDGAIELVRDGATISGGGSFGHLLVNAGAGAILRSGSSLVLGSLYLATGNQLAIDSNNLTVNGSFSSGTPFGNPGVIASSGIITLNGSVYGSAQGTMRFGAVQASGSHPGNTPPSTYGTFGEAGKSVTFTGSRRVSFSRLVGMVTVDSAATVEADGIGVSGGNTVIGSLWVYGTLAALDDRYTWMIEGDLYNYGTIDYCTVVMTGHHLNLRTDAGTWGHDASLDFIGDAASELDVVGGMTLPQLSIHAASALDSDIVINAGHSVMLVRHLFSSDQSRGCRLLSDTLVQLRNDAHGIIQGDVSFEGFWDSEIGGTYGGTGRRVQLMMPKHVTSPLFIEGMLTQTPNARLSVSSTASLPEGTLLAGEVVIDPNGLVTARGDLRVDRDVYGGGTLEMLGAAPMLDVRGRMRDSILLSIGRDTLIAHLSIAHTFSVPRMTVYVGSSFSYHAGDSIDVTNDFRYRLLLPMDFSMVSAAAMPFDGRAVTIFPGANSRVFRYDDAIGYSITDSIRVGEGYWVSYPAPTIIEQRGGIINAPQTFHVNAGWNIIGTASIPINVARIVTDGTTRISDFFEFIGGYGSASVLQPGHGYWVQFSTAGTMTLNAEP